MYRDWPTSPSLASQQPHLRQSSCQKRSMAWIRTVREGREEEEVLTFKTYLSWIFLLQPAHTWMSLTFPWTPPLAVIIMSGWCGRRRTTGENVYILAEDRDQTHRSRPAHQTREIEYSWGSIITDINNWNTNLSISKLHSVFYPPPDLCLSLS